MNIRKDRRHFCGNSNVDYKALTKEELLRPDSMGQIDFLSLPKMKTLNDVLNKRERHIATAPQPLEETRTLYKENNKPLKKRPKLENPRFHQLEEYEKRKWAFTADSYTTFDPHPANQSLYRRFERSKSGGAQRVKGLAKREMHSKAAIETQQVALPQFQRETKKSLIDMDKVKEVRRAIRRRYANARNFQKIFNQWDAEGKGHISLQNIFDMCKRLGLDINQTECKILLASADRERIGRLNLNDFLDLIFNDANILNVNISSLPYGEGPIKESEEEALKNIVTDDAIKMEQRRHDNQINLILKNKIKD